MKTKQEQIVSQKLQDIFQIPPNDLGNQYITSFYKLFTRPLKKLPFLFIVPLSAAVALAGYLMFGHLIIHLVSLLQYGF
ncbi:MAG: hypothetical protein ACEQSA_03905 [Weeksellaceae bacterium]